MKTFGSLLALAAIACATALAPHGHSWTKVGRAAPAEQMSFSVALPMRNLDKLESAFWAISTPGSCVCKHFTLNLLQCTLPFAARPSASS